MKKITLSLICITCWLTLAAQPYSQFATPRTLEAAGYPAHVDLRWDNQKKFTYEIFASKDGGKKFVKRAETAQSYYYDFVEDFVGKAPAKLVYRVVPKGMPVSSKDAGKFEVKVATVERTDDALLDLVQQYTTRYFTDFAYPGCNLARERSNDTREVVTTGGTGFGVMALVAAAERGYITREQSTGYISGIVEFLDKVERFHGVWAHWYDAISGQPFSFSKYDDGGDLVETAFLVQGLLTARQYFKNGSAAERKLCNRITKMWEEVEWSWYTQGTDSLYWHWSKNHGWKMNHRIKGYDETLITYILAAASPTHPIAPSVYHSCYPASTYFKNGKEYLGIKLSLGMDYGGPLFFCHYSFLGLDPRGLNDSYADYFERNRAHTLIHRAYAVANPYRHKGYGASFWGFTSSDDALTEYSSHHPNTEADNGTVSPTAALSSLPYAPQECMEVVRNLYYNMGASTLGPYGFYDAVNLNLPQGQQVVRTNLAIDQGPIAVMVENYRSGLLWKLFMQNPEVHEGLKSLGFYYKEDSLR
ncbi:MAG: beta-glucosidase [Prevotellaceae bacterium]|jgi:hypothetical protein|nr:beta-glucosidase [Prevotellaceae bacterium]